MVLGKSCVVITNGDSCHFQYYKCIFSSNCDGKLKIIQTRRVKLHI